MELNDLLGNTIFFVLDIILAVILIPLFIKLHNRKKSKHLTSLTMTAINELVHIGGITMMRFTKAGKNYIEANEQVNKMSEEEKEKFGVLSNTQIKFKNDTLDFLTQFSHTFEKEVDAFRSTIELFSPHFGDAETLIFISTLNQNSRYIIGSMEAIILSIKLNGNIPEELYGSINRAYLEMYDEVILHSQKKGFELLDKPMSLEEVHEFLNQSNS